MWLELLLHLSAGLISPAFPGALGAKTKTQVKNNSGVTPAGLCGTWVKEPEGGYFTSPNYPEKYPPERECVYIIEAAPRQCVELFFDEKYSIEPSWDCKFDHIEVRDGPFLFSPIIGRFCGQESPPSLRSTGRYLYVKFVADGELEALGFSARYNFTQAHRENILTGRLDPEFKDLTDVPELPFCEFEMTTPEGIVESSQIYRDIKASPTEAVDCRWYIQAPPRAKIYLRFLEYEMHNSNECKRNFVAIYDGSSSVEHLKNKFCSTVANDVMLTTPLGVVRMWADEGSRNSRFRILYTIFHEPPCEGEAYFCHSNMCINNTLVCNGIQNCVYPWDENNCKEKRKPSIFDTMDSTNLSIIGVTCSLVLIMLIISVVIQIKQPRKKYIIRRDDFDPALLHPNFEPPHYELCTLRRDPSGDLNDAAIAEDFEKCQKFRRSSSKCIRDHHCGSQGSVHGSIQGSRNNLSLKEATTDCDSVAPPPIPPMMVSQQSPHLSHHTPTGRRNIVVMKHSYSQDAAEYRSEMDDDLAMAHGPTTSRHHIHHYQMHHGMPGVDQMVHRTLSNDF